MAAFLAEGSKFLFFDTSICRSTVWFPSGAESLPRVAESCELGATGQYSIGAGAVFFTALILVCLKAPEKRLLKKDYGSNDYDHHGDLESANEYGHSDGSFGVTIDHMYIEGRDSYDESRLNTGGDRERAEMIYTPRGSRRSLEEEILFSPGGASRLPDDDDEAHMDNFSYGLDQRKSAYHRSSRGSDDQSMISDGRDSDNQHSRLSLDSRDEADILVMARMKTLDSSDDRYKARPVSEKDNLEKDDRYQPTKPPLHPTKVQLPPPPGQLSRISASRISTIEKMELNTSIDTAGEIIEKFVSDLNLSFQLDDEQEKGKGLLMETDLCQTLCSNLSARSF
jgi:hypothetical protein